MKFMPYEKESSYNSEQKAAKNVKVRKLGHTALFGRKAEL